eukprot:scaffold91223_cov69-Phaeocystis_antarctica.AAC.4
MQLYERSADEDTHERELYGDGEGVKALGFVRLHELDQSQITNGCEQAHEDAPDFVLNRDEEHPASQHQALGQWYNFPPVVHRVVLLVQNGGGLHHARAAPLPQRLSVGVEEEEEHERHPDRPEH